MPAKYSIGLDYGTNSIRALVVNTANGREVASAVWHYARGEHGVILSPDPNLARQHPADYVDGARITIKKALALAKRNARGFQPEQVVGLGVDTTGSTPIPVDERGQPLALNETFAKFRIKPSPCWLWRGSLRGWRARRRRRSPVSRGNCARNISPNAAAFTAVNGSSAKSSTACGPIPASLTPLIPGSRLADWVPAMLTGTEAHEKLTVGVCAAGHKAMHHTDWGGYPDGNSFRDCTPSWVVCARACLLGRSRLTVPSEDLLTIGLNALACPVPACRLRSGPSMPILAQWVAASSRGPW